jgi:hypothetical protein
MCPEDGAIIQSQKIEGLALNTVLYVSYVQVTSEL